MAMWRICGIERVWPRTRRAVVVAVTVVVVSMLIGCSRVPSSHSSPLPLKPVGEVALPGDGSRFDYASLDSGRGLLFIAHLGASEVIEVDVHANTVVRIIPMWPRCTGCWWCPSGTGCMPPPPARIRWSSWTRTPAGC